MTWIERTAYPRLPRAVSLKELRESFTPSDDEMAWARTHTQSDRYLLALVVWLKCYQRLQVFRPKAPGSLKPERGWLQRTSLL